MPRPHGRYHRAGYVVGRPTRWSPTRYGLGDTEIADMIDKAQTALALTDRGFARKCGITLRVLNALKSPLGKRVRAPARFTTDARLTLEPPSQRALKKVVQYLEGLA